MPRRLSIGLLAATVAMALAAAPVQSASPGGCDSFDFPLATELAWMKAADSETVASGADLAAPPDKAMVVTLQPMTDVAYVIPPAGKAKDGDATSGAIIKFAGVPTPGLYQVSLSDKGWIDVIQNGAALDSKGHTGKSDCDGLRKSVRFELGTGPFVLQLSRASAGIKVTIRKAD